MPRRRRHTNYRLLLPIVGLEIGVACYVLGMAGWQSRQYPLYDFEDLLIPRLLDVVILFWWLWVGSAIGSFLNVVAWRVPRGESISGRSRCPRCQATLSLRDNFPVIGWLAVQGRCRTCRLPISSRYPIVEAAVGLSVTAVGVTELFRLALPYQTSYYRGGPLWAPIIDRTMLAIMAYHIVVLSYSWAYGLIRYDGHRIPRKLIVFGLAAATIPLLVYPPATVVPWQTNTPADWPPQEIDVVGGLMNALLRVLTALVASVFFARLFSQRWLPDADLKMNPLGGQTVGLVDLMVVIGLPSMVLGWQATPLVLLFALLITDVLRRPFVQLDVHQRFALAMPVAMSIHIAIWRFTHRVDMLASVDSPPFVMITTTVLVWLASIAIARHSALPTSLGTKRKSARRKRRAEDRLLQATSVPSATPIATTKVNNAGGDPPSTDGSDANEVIASDVKKSNRGSGHLDSEVDMPSSSLAASAKTLT